MPFVHTSKTLDLLTLKGTEAVLAMGNLQNGHYTGFRFLIDSGNAVQMDGSTCDLKVPSGKVEVPVVFDMSNGKTTKIVTDFNGEQSVHVVVTGGKNGKHSKCILRPVLKVMSVQ